VTDLVVGDFQQKSRLLHAASEPETHLVGETGDVVAADRNVRVFPAATLVDADEVRPRFQRRKSVVVQIDVREIGQPRRTVEHAQSDRRYAIVAQFQRRQFVESVENAVLQRRDEVVGCADQRQGGEVAEAAVGQSGESVVLEMQCSQRGQSTDGARNARQWTADDSQFLRTTVRQITGQQRVQLCR